MSYHRVFRIIISTEPIQLNCPDCDGEDEVEVWPIGDDVYCDHCGAGFRVTRTDGVVTLDDSVDDKDDWQPPPRLYHGTSLTRFSGMLAKPDVFKLYLADDPEGTEGYATEAAAMDDESEPVTVVFDTQKLLSLGKLMPDWDDVDTMISNGETDAEGNPLFGDVDSAREVMWQDSLRLINTCSYEGPVLEAIIEVQVGSDGRIERPPFDLDDGGRAASRWRWAVGAIDEARPTVSFDFDDVLHYAPDGNPIDFWTPESYVPRKRYTAELRRLSTEHRVIIVSHRDPGMESTVYKFARIHDLDIDAVFCLGVQGSKQRVLEDEGATLHYDDSPYVEDELRESGVEFVKVPRTAINDLTWVPDNMWDEFPEIYRVYAERVGVIPPRTAISKVFLPHPDGMNAIRIAKRIVAETALTLPPGTERLPDNKQWTNRFEVHSETSDRVYIIAQHRDKGHWGCSCPAWRTRRKCKHLKSLGLPELEVPHQVTIASRT